MFKAPHWWVIICTLAICAVPTPSIASDLAVWVGLSYDNLPEGAQPTVRCYAYMNDPSGGDGGISIGAGSQIYNEQSMSLDVVIDIEFDEHLPGANPDYVDYVICGLYLNDGEDFVLSYDDCMAEGIDPLRNPLLCAPRGGAATGWVSHQVAR